VRHQSKAWLLTISVRPSLGVRGEEILKDEGRGGKERESGRCLSPFAVSSFLSYLAFSLQTPDTSVTKILALCTLHVSLRLGRFHRKWCLLSELPYNGLPSCLKSFI